MLASLSKFLLLLLVIYVVRQVFRSMSAGPAVPGSRPRFTAAAHSAGTIWRDLGRSRAPAAPQKAAVDLTRCDRCGSYASPGAGCDRPDCIRR